MAFSKVILNGTTLIDLTQDTATDAYVASPKTYHKADGTGSTGTATIAVNFLLAYEFTDSYTRVSFTPSYADTKTAIQSNAKFSYMCVGDYACGMVFGISTNYNFHGTTFTECVRFALEDTNAGGMYQVAWGYVSGSLTTRTYKIYSNVPTGTINISQNGQGIDVSQYASADVAVSGGNDFVVTVSWNSSTSRWEPNKTFSEIQTAYNAGKTIAVKAGDDVATADGRYNATYNRFEYTTRSIYDAEFEGIVTEIYRLTSSGLTLYDSNTAVYPTGTKTITQSGTGIDVYTYAEVDVPAGSATAPATISGTSATVSTGTNTLTLSKTVSVTPSVSAGYVSSGTAGNSSVSLQASVTTKAAATITPGTSNQTIASGTYLTGTQTISGDANLVAGNIKSGTSIFGVTGTYSGGSSKNIQVNQTGGNVRTNGYTSTGVSITVAKAGTYNVSWTAWRSSSQGTMGTNLYKNNTAGTNQQTWTSTYGQHITLSNQTYAQGDVLTLYATAGSTTRYCYVGDLVIVEQ